MEIRQFHSHTLDVLFARQEGGAEMPRARPLTETRTRNGDDAGLIQETGTVFYIWNLVRLLAFVHVLLREHQVGEAIHRAVGWLAGHPL